MFLKLITHSNRLLTLRNVKPVTFNLHNTLKQLTENDFKMLWSNLDKTKSQQRPPPVNNVEYNEFKFVLNSVQSLLGELDEASKADQRLHFNIYKSFAKKLFANSRIAVKFLDNNSTWSLIFDNLAYFCKACEVSETTRRTSLKTIELDIMQSIFFWQFTFDNEYMSVADVDEARLNMNELKSTTDLINSLYDYLTTSTPERRQLTNDEIVLKFMIKINLNYVYSYLLLNKQSLKRALASELHAHQLDAYLRRFDGCLNGLMKVYRNLDAIPEPLKREFFEFFSFHVRYWSSALDWLMDAYRTVRFRAQIGPLVPAMIQASIRFENWPVFDDLMLKLDTINFMKLKHLRLFRDYFNQCLSIGSHDELSKRIEHIMNIWCALKYVANEEVLFNFSHLVNRLNTLGTSRWKLSPIRVNYQGVCSNGMRLDEAKYDERQLDELAQLFRAKIVEKDNKEYMQEIKMVTIGQVDRIMERMKFDYVIDGMNLVYTRPKNIDLGSISGLLETIGEKKRVLIFLRNHLLRDRSQQGKLIGRLKATYGGYLHVLFVNSELNDDRLAIYSTLRSGPKTFLVSNDFFRENKMMFADDPVKYRLYESWTFNRMVKLHQNHRRLIYPPVYELKTHRFEQSPDVQPTWIIPFIKKINLEEKVFFKMFHQI